jgi:hypothetical protein
MQARLSRNRRPNHLNSTYEKPRLLRGFFIHAQGAL